MGSYQLCDHDWPKRCEVLRWNPQQENTKHQEHLGRDSSARIHTQSLSETLWQEGDRSELSQFECLFLALRWTWKIDIDIQDQTLDEGQIEMILVEFSTEHGKCLALQQHGFLVYISKQFQGAALHAYSTTKHSKKSINQSSMSLSIHFVCPSLDDWQFLTF